VKSVRSASEAFKLYFDTSVMDAIVAETSQYSSKFIDTHRAELK
jgi:hypothetical protein